VLPLDLFGDDIELELLELGYVVLDVVRELFERDEFIERFEFIVFLVELFQRDFLVFSSSFTFAYLIFFVDVLGRFVLYERVEFFDFRMLLLLDFETVPSTLLLDKLLVLLPKLLAIELFL
jgi:hypothetical protein